MAHTTDLLGSSVLDSGPLFSIREMTIEDRAGVRELFEGLSPAARYMRWLQPVPRLTGAILHVLLYPDGWNNYALIATDGGRCIGVARFVRYAGRPHVADVAVTVAESHWGRGIGRALLTAVIDAARDRDVCELTFIVHVANRRAARLIRSLGVRLEVSGGVHGRGPAIEAVDVSTYVIPTDAPESDGTLEWDRTTLVVVEIVAGGVRGLCRA